MKISLYRKYNEGYSCEEAMEFYKNVVFGAKGDWSSKATWGNSPAKNMKVADPDKDGDKIMHMGLPLTKTFELYGCDGGVKMAKAGACADAVGEAAATTTSKDASEEKKSEDESEEPQEKKQKNRSDDYSLWVAADSKEHADKLFGDLSGNGGKVSMPMCDMFWGDYYGMCTDAYGTHWMISYGASSSKTEHSINSKYGDGKLQINVYRSFNDGKCAEAFDFYKKVFGGEFSWKGTYDKAPDDADFAPKNVDDKDKVMHMSLPLTKEFTLQGCDIVEMEGDDQCDWSPYNMSLMLTSKEEADTMFDALKTDGGKVVMPIDDMFWGDYFGIVQDRFGNSWNVSYNAMNAELIAGESATTTETKKNKMKVNVYRNFQGNCAEAFDFYKSVFGGDFSWKVEWSKAPADTVADLERDGGKIMHVGLPLSDTVELMGCDEVPMKAGEGGAPAHVSCSMDTAEDDEDSGAKRRKLEDGSTSTIPPSAMTKNMHISLSPESKERAEELMAKLSADGGVVQVPLAQKFWGSYFGSCMDRFGTQWMFDYYNQTPHSQKEGETTK